jgi:hypothetical protein
LILVKHHLQNDIAQACRALESAVSNPFAKRREKGVHRQILARLAFAWN